MPKTKRVIVAEDNQFLLETIALNMEENNVEVQTAANGQETIALIEEQIPDLLLIDLMMPVMNGQEVISYIEEKGYNIPTVILSNLLPDTNKAELEQFEFVKTYMVKSDMDEADVWPKIKPFLVSESPV